MENKKCKCGKYVECIRKIGATENGKLFIIGGAINHFKCGVVQEQIYKLNKIFNESKKD